MHGEVIELAVVDDDRWEAVMLVMLGEKGVLSGAKPGSVVAIYSTIHPKKITKVAEQAKLKGTFSKGNKADCNQKEALS